MEKEMASITPSNGAGPSSLETSYPVAVGASLTSIDESC